VSADPLADALLHALIGRLDVRWANSPHGGSLVVIAPAQRPVGALPGLVPLDDTDRAPVVPLRPPGGDRA
jgi:hypothetical protein